MLFNTILIAALSASAMSLGVKPKRANIGDADCRGNLVMEDDFLTSQKAVEEMGSAQCPPDGNGLVGPCTNGAGIHVYDISSGVVPVCSDVADAAAILLQDCGATVDYYGDAVNGNVGVNSQYHVGVLNC